MPAYKNVEVWIEDSTHRKLDHQELTINLVDPGDRTVTAKIEMPRDEPYTIHCLSPVSVFCDVFVISASRVRKSAARFYLDKSVVVSNNASGSSVGHLVGQFIEHGLRTPKRQFHHGDLKLGIIEVEIRRIDRIIEGKFWGGYVADKDEGVATDLIMIDGLDQPPWLVFRFDICLKEPLAVPASTAKHVRKRMPNKTLRASSIGSSNETSREIGRARLHSSKKRRRECDGHDGSFSSDGNSIDNSSSSGLSSDLLQLEYQQEEAEERRLLRKLQERLQTKKARNVELRRLLGETASNLESSVIPSC